MKVFLVDTDAADSRLLMGTVKDLIGKAEYILYTRSGINSRMLRFSSKGCPLRPVFPEQIIDLVELYGTGEIPGETVVFLYSGASFAAGAIADHISFLNLMRIPTESLPKRDETPDSPSRRSRKGERPEPDMPVRVISLSDRGRGTAERIAEGLKRNRENGGSTDIALLSPAGKDITGEVGKFWSDGGSFVFIGSAGRAVRTIVPHVREGTKVPPVVVTDESGRYVTGLLSDDEGTADTLAAEVATLTKGETVLGGRDGAGCSVVVGLGSRASVPAKRVEEAVTRALKKCGLTWDAVCGFATIDGKAEERGIIETARKYGVAVRYFSSRKISMAGRLLQVDGVAEPCALLASGGGGLLERKHRYGGITVSIALVMQ